MVDYSKWDKLEVSDSDTESDEEASAPRKHELRNSSSNSSSSSSRGIDYSKWDHIGDEEEEEEKAHAPRVRRLTKDQTVSIGPSGFDILSKAEATRRQQQQQQQREQQELLQKWVEEEQQEALSETGMSFEDAHEWPRCGAVQAAELPPAAAAAADAAAAAAGLPAVLSTGIGKAEMEKRIRNGGVSPGRYFWSQTPSEVTLSLLLPHGVRGRDLRVHLTEQTLRICCTPDSLLSTTTSNGSSSIDGSIRSSIGEHVLLEGSFPHPVEADDDCWLWEVTERRINWQQLQQLAEQQQQPQAPSSSSSTGSSSSDSSSGSGSNGSSSMQDLPQEVLPPPLFFLDLHLRKKKILPTADVWWPRILKGEAGIDVSQLAGRRHREKTQSFKDAWYAAHAAFKEKVKHHPRSNFAALLAAAAADAAAADGDGPAGDSVAAKAATADGHDSANQQQQ
ncbi:nuclear movement domain-containing protein, putative [Eimeria maxima]|uniref:Nuclear movement domain-containing protein, putative n=1 Tax=Eimeria maxima TaxID=5804 RepID=U6M559_EIMMA|nr:nuclear movement domain-containing protein, putative [Eimeria maxima]CDJ56815.1 nuclear movement domain-containing protein, putative [Eimeria maxima]